MSISPKKRQVPRLILLALAGLTCSAHYLHAAEKSYDIDLKEIRKAAPSYDINLKELRKSPQRRAKTHRKHTRKAVQVTTSAPDTAPQNSNIYTVQQGDFPLLILTRHYGLSQAAAEQLIPEMMRLNNLRNPRDLTVGQRLIIPLPVVPPTQAPSKDAAAATPPVAPASKPSVQPAIALPAVAPPVVQSPVVLAPAAAPPVMPPPIVQTPPIQPSPAKAVPAREIKLPPAPPCELTSKVAELLGLRIPDITALTQAGSTSMAYKGRKLVVACGLTEAETYTSQKILARHGAQLLLFNGDEPPREVIEELADSLGIPCQPDNETVANGLPATYTLSGADSLGQDVRLTILPAPIRDKKTSH